jgi:tRNA(Arg) A34 adenosine deaminase TadA
MTRLHEAIEEAAEMATQSDGPFRHGCVIMSGKKIISRGNNHIRTQIGTASVHAELDALWRIQNTDAYENLKAVIIRSSKTGQLGNSRPCTMCYAALKQHGVKTIVYSTMGGKIAMEKIN